MTASGLASTAPDHRAAAKPARIYMDVSTTWAAKDRNVAGILRAEIECARYLLSKPKEAVGFVVFSPDRGCFVEPDRTLIRALVSRVGGSAGSPLPLAAVRPSASAKVGRTLLTSLLAVPRLAWSSLRALKTRKEEAPVSDRARNAVERIRQWVGRLLSSKIMVSVFGERSVSSETGPGAEMPEAPKEQDAVFDAALLNLPRAHFEGHCYFITLGAGWGRVEFFREIERLKREADTSVISMVYDTIPVKFPAVMRYGVDAGFTIALYRMAWLSDVIACISHSTERDLITLSNELDLPERATEVIQLGCSVPGDPNIQLTRDRFPELGERPFVLFVGSIEPRKNHDLSYQLWRRLAEERPDLIVPLAWVGADYWNTDDLLSTVGRDPLVHPDNLIWYKNCPDQELRWLYENCLFTIYPSDYEGWGLPVVESLRFGKHCITGVGSSLEEASQGLASHIDPLDGAAWYAEIVRCLEDPGYLKEREGLIRRSFKAHDWKEAAERLFIQVTKRADQERAKRERAGEQRERMAQ